MIIIYCCYGGAHSSPIAAAVHLGELDPQRIPTAQEIQNVRYFDKVDGQERGMALPVGTDERGTAVYVCGRGKEKRGIEQAIHSGFRLAGGAREDIVFVDTLPAVNTLMRLGGFLSRVLKWVRIGRPLVIRGTQSAYLQLVQIVTTATDHIDPLTESTNTEVGKKRERQGHSE